MQRIVSWFTEQSYRKAWVVIVAVLALVGFGAYSTSTIDQELLPDIEFPLAVVVVESPGEQPQQIAESVVAPIETVTSEITGLNSMESTTVSGLSVILYNFDFGTSLEDIETELQNSINAVPLAPSVQFQVLTFDPSATPVVIFDVQGGELSQPELFELTQGQVVPALSDIEGVATVEVVGGAINEVRITLDRQQMLELGISYEQVSQSLTTNNVFLPSGELQSNGATLPLQTVAVLTNLDQIEAITIPTEEGDGVSLGEIAEVELIEGTQVGFSRTDGSPSLSVQVSKEKAANTVGVSNAVMDEIGTIEESLPEGVELSIFLDQSEVIEDSVNGVIEEGVIGGILAVIVVFLFLRNWRTTLITAVSIPLSLIAAIIVLDLLDHSLNIMTLAGLTIAIGRVIDDTIVVLENVYRHMSEGAGPYEAIREGAREVTVAILGATAVTCAVFLPLGLSGGIVGELFLPFAIAVVAALAASLLIAVTVVPMMSRFLLAGKVKKQEKRAADGALARFYTPILKWSLKNRWKTLGISTLLLVGSLALLPLLPVAFLPDAGENAITVSIDAQPGETAENVLESAIAVEELLGEFDVETYQTVITGASSDFAAIGSIISGTAPNSATITVSLEGGVDKQEAASELRELIASEIPESESISVSAAGGDFGGGGISITLAADTDSGQEMLPEFTQQVAETVASNDETANVSSNLSSVQNSIQVHVDTNAAAEYGLTPNAISENLSNLSSSQTITMVNLESGMFPVRLLVSGGDIGTIEELGALEIVEGVRLDSIATLVEVPTQVSITRVDGSPAASVTADITSENTGGVSAEVQQSLNELEVPEGVEVMVGGVAGDIDEGFTNLAIAIVIAIALVYGIMALLFQSWMDPLVILFSLPLAVIGAIVALVVTGSALSLSALIGILMLVGIVVTNAIVLVEFVIMLREERGYSMYDALIEGAQTRLRPILMTAFAAILALVPLSLGLTEGLLIAADLGRVVIGGLFTSTLLTLLVVPVMYSFADGLKKRFGHSPLEAAPTTVEPEGSQPAGD